MRQVRVKTRITVQQPNKSKKDIGKSKIQNSKGKRGSEKFPEFIANVGAC